MTAPGNLPEATPRRVAPAFPDRSDTPPLEPGDTPNHPLAPWFADARRNRREYYAARPAAPKPRRHAVVTMVHNEPDMLTFWLRYYSRFFAPQDIFVLDNDSTDGSTERDGFVRVPAQHATFDDAWRARTFEGMQRELLDRYDVVVVTDVDEIVVPSPAVGTLADYLDRFDEQWVNCLGYELLHLKDREPPIDPRQPILRQRGHWYFNGAYDKAAIATEPMQWRPGFHGREDFEYSPDPDLRLVHLHRMDYELCKARHRTQRDRPWAEEAQRGGWGAHNRIAEEPEFGRWFYEDSSFENFEIQLEQIPAIWRGAF